jgi:hypothetical protein
MYQKGFKENWLSDPATYPILIILSSAMCFIVGMTANAFTTYKDLRISPSVKHETLQNWGDEKVPTVTEKLGGWKTPLAWHSQAFVDIRQEGVGIDHEEWVKNKEAYMKE